MNGKSSGLGTERVVVGGAIIAFSVAMLFWWGFHFQVFGSEIDWLKRPEQLGFVAWLIVGSFGAGFQVGGHRTALKAMGWATAVLLVAILLGTVRTFF
jgi:hypothetical protein